MTTTTTQAWAIWIGPPQYSPRYGAVLVTGQRYPCEPGEAAALAAHRPRHWRAATDEEE